MLEFDTHIARLQYEILNVPLSQLASDANIPVGLLEQEAKASNWKQWWPEEDTVVWLEKQRKIALESEEAHTANSEEEMLSQQSEEYIERTRKRLQVYSLAKEIYLAQKYLKLEAALIKKAHDILEECQTIDPAGIKQLSALYKDMVSKSPMSTLLSVSADESGIPNLIIRDLSGR